MRTEARFTLHGQAIEVSLREEKSAGPRWAGFSVGDEQALLSSWPLQNESRAARVWLSYLIRQAETSDGSGVYVVETECFQDPYPRKLLEDLIVTERDSFFVATVGEEIVGYAVAAASKQSGHVISVAVAPNHRRKGIGAALLSAVMSRLIQEGVCVIHLEVRKGNKPAIGFYEQMGFQKSSEIKRYYSDGEDAWVLVRRTESSGDR